MLRDLAGKVEGAKILGGSSVNISGVSVDSRQIEKGDLFVALKGGKSNGLDFIPEAIRRGAVAVASQEPGTSFQIPAILVPDLHRKLGRIAAIVYENPSERMTVVGITGTNGKTTTAHLIEYFLLKLGCAAGYVGTLGYRWSGKDHAGQHTTPEASELQKILKLMVDEKVSHVVMECSSHGIELDRLSAVEFDVALFTNLTQDHLDFHGTMDAYREAKKKLFTKLLKESSKPKRSSVINIDDPTGRMWASEFECTTFSIHDSHATVYAKDVTLRGSGMEAEIWVSKKPISFTSDLVGAHNLSNFLGAFSVGHVLGLPLDEVGLALKNFPGVPGRLERIQNQIGIHVFVDYAHTDDALFNVLKALLPLKTDRLILVFGCGGDRDKKKRPKMAKVGSGNADIVILTSDNPRTEVPETIIEEMIPGISSQMRKVDPEDLDESSSHVASSIVDRRSAICTALSIARQGDLVLIAGKGHETYQEINGVRHAFDDRVVAREFFQEKLN